jgi:glutaredoxin
MERKVVVFTRPDCPPCYVVKLFLGVLGLPFEERDLSRDQAAQEELIGKYGSNSTPTLVIGDQVMIGFDPARLDELLAE